MTTTPPRITAGLPALAITTAVIAALGATLSFIFFSIIPGCYSKPPSTAVTETITFPAEPAPDTSLRITLSAPLSTGYATLTLADIQIDNPDSQRIASAAITAFLETVSPDPETVSPKPDIVSPNPKIDAFEAALADAIKIRQLSSAAKTWTLDQLPTIPDPPPWSSATSGSTPEGPPK